MLSIALPLAQRLMIAFMLPVVNDASMAMPSAEALHTHAPDLSPVLLHSHTIQAEIQRDGTRRKRHASWNNAPMTETTTLPVPTPPPTIQGAARLHTTSASHTVAHTRGRRTAYKATSRACTSHARHFLPLPCHATNVRPSLLRRAFAMHKQRPPQISPPSSLARDIRSLIRQSP